MKAIAERTPFVSTTECFKKYGRDWGKPSICFHINEDGTNFKPCIKCGRVIFEKDNRFFFYFPNGVRYLIRKKRGDVFL